MMGVILLIEDRLFHTGHIFRADPITCFQLDISDHFLPWVRGLMRLWLT